MIERVYDVFGEMEEKGIERNTMSYNFVLLTCVKERNCKMALDLYRQMDRNKIPKNAHTYSAIIKACNIASYFEEAIDIYKEMQQTGEAGACNE
jgi:pentatricopeptide repeat protein